MYLYFMYLTKIFHILVVFVIVFFPFIVKDTELLKVVILVNIVTVVGWHLNGHCFISDIESYFEKFDKKETITQPETEKKDYDRKALLTQNLVKFFPFIDKQLLYLLASLTPVFSTIVCLKKL